MANDSGQQGTVKSIRQTVNGTGTNGNGLRSGPAGHSFGNESILTSASPKARQLYEAAEKGDSIADGGVIPIPRGQKTYGKPKGSVPDPHPIILVD